MLPLPVRTSPEGPRGSELPPAALRGLDALRVPDASSLAVFRFAGVLVSAALLAVASVACANQGAGASSGGAGSTSTGANVRSADLPGAAAGDTLLFDGARLILGDGRAIEAGALLVEGDRIAEVGYAGAVRLPPGGVRVDATGKTIIPALIDAHAHLGYEGYTSWGADRYSRENLIDNLHHYAYYGFAAVFSAGTDPLPVVLALQKDQRAGKVGGARLLFAGGVAPPHQGPNDRFLVESEALSKKLGTPVVRGAGTPEEGRARVRELAALGIHVVKIWVDDRGGSQVKMPPEIYRAIVDEAHRNGMDVVVHQEHAEDMPDLVRAGVTGFMHGRLGPELDDSVAALVARRGVWVIPNLGLAELRREDVAADPFLRNTLGPAVAERLDSAWAARKRSAAPGSLAAPETPEREKELRASMGRLLDAGVILALGTDAGAVPDHFFGYAGHRELEIFVRLGMTPMQALVAGTGTAARILGLSDTGTLEEGKSADFVVLDANPLQDIRNTRKIGDVYLRGRRVDREALRRAWTGGEAGR